MVECTVLERRQGESLRGFESLPLRSERSERRRGASKLLCSREGIRRPQRCRASRRDREGRPASLLSDGETKLVGESLPLRLRSPKRQATDACAKASASVHGHGPPIVSREGEIRLFKVSLISDICILTLHNARTMRAFLREGILG